MISVIIPFKDDNYLLEDVIQSVNNAINPLEDEIILVDDGSYEKPSQNILSKHKNITVLTNPTNKGVGYSFDKGVLRAIGDVLLLMGGDVLLRGRKSFREAVLLSQGYSKSIICSACVGLREPTLDWDDKRRRYGADILFKMDKDDLPLTSSLRAFDEYTDILQCRWLKGKQHDEPYEIPSVLGAAYLVKRDWYMHIGGWGHIKDISSLSREESKWCGHTKWGGLEPMISLKSWFAGGSCMIDPAWETGHIFGRGEHTRRVRGRRMDTYYFNKLFIAYSLFDIETAKGLDEHLLHGHNQNIARTMIKRNWNAVMLEKGFNDRIKERGLEVFVEKFGYNLDF